MKSGAGFRPEQRGRHKVVIREDVEPFSGKARRYRHARVDYECQCPLRERAIAATTSGIGRPERVFSQGGGSGSISPSSSIDARSASSITCCVPTLRARNLPDRIQRRIVSGSRPARRAASGTVSTGVVYYNTPGRLALPQSELADPTRPAQGRSGARSPVKCTS